MRPRLLADTCEAPRRREVGGARPALPFDDQMQYGLSAEAV